MSYLRSIVNKFREEESKKFLKHYLSEVTIFYVFSDVIKSVTRCDRRDSKRKARALENILNKTNMKLDGLNVRRNRCEDLFSLPDTDREELGWEITDPGKSD